MRWHFRYAKEKKRGGGELLPSSGRVEERATALLYYILPPTLDPFYNIQSSSILFFSLDQTGDETVSLVYFTQRQPRHRRENVEQCR